MMLQLPLWNALKRSIPPPLSLSARAKASTPDDDDNVTIVSHPTEENSCWMHEWAIFHTEASEASAKPHPWLKRGKVEQLSVTLEALDCPLVLQNWHIYVD